MRLVEFHQHVGRRHALDKVVRRHDHVIALIAGAQLGEQFVIAGEQRHVHIDAAAILVIFKRGLTDIGVPVVEVQLGLFAIGKFRCFLLAATCERAGE